MSNIFKYSLLQYEHSQTLGEKVNIGLFLFFPFKNNEVRFVFPESLRRIKAIYPDIQDRKIKYYLEAISKKTNELNQSNNLFSIDINSNTDIARLIDTSVLKNDDSALHFSELKQSLLYTNDIDQISNDLFKDYLCYYEVNHPIKHIKDTDVSHKYISKLKSILDDFENRIKQDVVISKDNFSYKFDVEWINGTHNLVKALSFDLTDQKSIQNKSVSLYGSLSLLEQEAKSKQYRFDLIVEKPQTKDFYKDFDNALKIIDKAPVNKHIIYDVDAYAYKTKSDLLHLS